MGYKLLLSQHGQLAQSQSSPVPHPHPKRRERWLFLLSARNTNAIASGFSPEAGTGCYLHLHKAGAVHRREHENDITLPAPCQGRTLWHWQLGWFYSAYLRKAQCSVFGLLYASQDWPCWKPKEPFLAHSAFFSNLTELSPLSMPSHKWDMSVKSPSVWIGNLSSTSCTGEGRMT